MRDITTMTYSYGTSAH